MRGLIKHLTHTILATLLSAAGSPVSRSRVGNADTAQARELWNRLSTQRRAGKLLKNGEDDD
ncbi:CaiF/GrlA family transcriptional regulator [Salmonella enterica]|nr:CaiF/GrlA family transcriptional regulator [Salmonella enterica]